MLRPVNALERRPLSQAPSLSGSQLNLSANVGVHRGGDGLDAVSVLTIYVLLLVCIPSRLVVHALGGAGTPANLVALACALWWLWETVRRSAPPLVASHPVRTCALFFFLAVCISYWVASTRPINPAEMTSADLGFLIVVAWTGLLLLAHDGVSSLTRLRLLLRRIVACGAFLSLVGLVQFVTGLPLTDHINIPGLTSNLPLDSVSSRDGFNRPASTALHAIEFSVVVTMILPLALTLARQEDGRGAFRRWFPVAAMAAIIPLTISRSALVGAVVGLILLLPTWPKTARRWLIAAGAAAGAAVFVLVPGVLGTILGLFTRVGGDSSARSRTDSYGIVLQYFQQRPIFGRGFSTFLPAYRILDNQYLGLLIDIGMVGLVVFLSLLIATILVAWSVRRHTSSSDVRELANGLASGVAVGAVGLALFDGLGFPMAAGFLFLEMGLAGSISRLVRESDCLLPPKAP
jgi:O-antigen ligase